MAEQRGSTARVHRAAALTGDAARAARSPALDGDTQASCALVSLAVHGRGRRMGTQH